MNVKFKHTHEPIVKEDNLYMMYERVNNDWKMSGVVNEKTRTECVDGTLNELLVESAKEISPTMGALLGGLGGKNIVESMNRMFLFVPVVGDIVSYTAEEID